MGDSTNEDSSQLDWADNLPPAGYVSPIHYESVSWHIAKARAHFDAENRRLYAPEVREVKKWWKSDKDLSGCDTCDEYLSKLTPLSMQLWHNHFPIHYRKTKVGNGAPTGAFAFTITKSPKDPYTVGDMLAAVRKVMHQKSCPVIKYAWYYEEKGRDENGDPIHPHIHGMYQTATSGVIEKKHWKRAWPIWDPSKPCGAGFRGGYHRPVRSDECYRNYISKDGGMSESAGLEETD